MLIFKEYCLYNPNIFKKGFVVHEINRFLIIKYKYGKIS